ncbi:hypothetical protein [Saccharothrix sp. HUAS TT1]|uniref:hypothetical protein n=1 Tax=unclassified Saccharothrix TaxID=2593673 RepID=UPI00345C5B6A
MTDTRTDPAGARSRIEELKAEVARLTRANAALAERPTVDAYQRVCDSVEVRRKALAEAMGAEPGTAFCELVDRAAILREASARDRERWLSHFDTLCADARADRPVDTLEMNAAYTASMVLMYVEALLGGHATEPGALGSYDWLLDAMSLGRKTVEDILARPRRVLAEDPGDAR